MNLTIDQISVILSLSGMIIASLALLIGTLGFIKAQAISRSTHSVQLMPVDSATDQYNEEYLRSLQDNDWATQPESIEKQNRLYAEDLEESMPQFVPSDEDSEVISF